MSVVNEGSGVFARSIRSVCKIKKTCPNCSVLRGALVFLPLESFGWSERRKTALNPDGVQSWCTECRLAALRRRSHDPNQLEIFG